MNAINKYRIRNKKNIMEWKLKNKEKLKAYNKKYGQEYRLKNKQYFREYNKQYYMEHKNRLNALSKIYRIEHAEQLTEYFKFISLRDKDKIRFRQRVKMAKRRSRDLAFRLKDSLGSRLRVALKGQIKERKIMELIGCSREFLLNWLESQFDDEMSWTNYGKDGWHIDHIKPCCRFDLTKENEQKECFNYSNLRPLWAVDNLARRYNYEEAV